MTKIDNLIFSDISEKISNKELIVDLITTSSIVFKNGTYFMFDKPLQKQYLNFEDLEADFNSSDFYVSIETIKDDPLMKDFIMEMPIDTALLEDLGKTVVLTGSLLTDAVGLKIETFLATYNHDLLLNLKTFGIDMLPQLSSVLFVNAINFANDLKADIYNKATITNDANKKALTLSIKYIKK